VKNKSDTGKEAGKDERKPGGVLKNRTLKKNFKTPEKSGDPDNGVHKGGVLRPHPFARRKIG